MELVAASVDTMSAPGMNNRGSSSNSLVDRIMTRRKSSATVVLPAMEKDLSFVEFSKLVRQDEPMISTEALQARFAPFDHDGDGIISKDEWRLEGLVRSVLEELTNGKLRAADAFAKWNQTHSHDADHSMDVDEFCRWVKS